MKKRWITLVSLVLAVTMLASFAGAAAEGTSGWQQSGNRWWYAYEDGSYARNQWMNAGGWYHFDNQGWAQTGWNLVDGHYYLFAPSGVMQTGWKQSGNNWYYLGSSGIMQTGWAKIGGSWYYFSNSGAMVTGWNKISGSWYYFGSSGAMVTGWNKIAGSWYYFNGSGTMVNGWQKIGNDWYYFRSSGIMATGWQSVGGTWYYFNPNGLMATGLTEIGNETYCFADSGAMLGSGWQKIGDDWYYMQSSGAVTKGWLTLTDDTYYFDANGCMVTGKQTIDGKEYTFGEDGRLVTENEEIDMDFGGATVYIYDWWSNGTRVANPDEETALLYEYRDQLEKKYNVKIVEIALSDWAGNIDELSNMVMNGDNSKLCLVMLSSDFCGSAVSNDLFTAWKIDLSSDKWQMSAADLDFMTKDGNVLGVHDGAVEPRACLYFNKRVLEEAGVDWNTIYDAQADGTWNWNMWEEIMNVVQRDIDNDGVMDIYGVTGSGDDCTLAMVFANGASFFDYDENGDLVPTINSDAGIEALQARVDLWNTYAAPQPEGSNWDWYKDFWKQGTTAFYVGQAWQGFNDYSEMSDMEDEWGCVKIPMGPSADEYHYMVTDNIIGVPNVYDDETALKLQKLYDLYTDPTPGVDNTDDWIGNKYNYTDDRAVDETYAGLRSGVGAVANKALLLGSTNNVLGSNLLWNLWNGTVTEVVEAAMQTWQEMCDVFNNK